MDRIVDQYLKYLGYLLGLENLRSQGEYSRKAVYKATLSYRSNSNNYLWMVERRQNSKLSFLVMCRRDFRGLFRFQSILMNAGNIFYSMEKKLNSIGRGFYKMIMRILWIESLIIEWEAQDNSHFIIEQHIWNVLDTFFGLVNWSSQSEYSISISSAQTH